MDWTSIPWTSLGPEAIAALAVLSLIRGDLIPRWTYQALERDRDHWRDAATTALSATASHAAISRIVAGVLEALPQEVSPE